MLHCHPLTKNLSSGPTHSNSPAREGDQGQGGLYLTRGQAHKITNQVSTIVKFTALKR